MKTGTPICAKSLRSSAASCRASIRSSVASWSSDSPFDVRTALSRSPTVATRLSCLSLSAPWAAPSLSAIARLQLPQAALLRRVRETLPQLRRTAVRGNAVVQCRLDAIAGEQQRRVRLLDRDVALHETARAQEILVAKGDVDHARQRARVLRVALQRFAQQRLGLLRRVGFERADAGVRQGHFGRVAHRIRRAPKV